MTVDNNISPLVLANDTALSVVGMTDSGLQGIAYASKPSTVNLTEFPEKGTELDLKVEKDKAIAGNYTLMITASLLEKDNLVLSTLHPLLVKLDVPTLPSEINKSQNFQLYSSKNLESTDSTTLLFRDIIRIGAITIAVALIGYLIYHNVVRRIKAKKPKT